MQPVFFAVGETFPALGLAEHYREYRVILCGQGAIALETLAQLKQLSIPVVLLMVDQTLPDMEGVHFLAQAKQLVPVARCLVVVEKEAKTALRVLPFKIDAFVRTCLPAEDFFFPVVDACLELEQQQSREVIVSALFTGIRIIGHRWSASSHQIKDFLARHAIPFQWIDLETQPERMPEDVRGMDHPAFPLVQFPDGSLLAQPTCAQIAAKIGLTAQSETPFYDLIIVGAGPAGLAAAVYGASEGLRTALIERDVPGGQAGMSSRIENYLGFPLGLSGSDLARRGIAQAARLGAHLLSPQEVTGIRVDGPYRFVTLSDGRELGCFALLLAMGVTYRSLAVPGLEHLNGSGVYYGAAMTEALACQGKQVCIVGGANSAGQAALYFADYAQQVRLLVRGTSLAASMSAYLIDEIQQRDNIEVQTQTEVTACLGEETLEHLIVERKTAHTKDTIAADALFIFIGAVPHTHWLPDSIARDQAGFVASGVTMGPMWALAREPLPLETSIPGIFVAGDVRAGSIKRVACATGDGAVAVSVIHTYLQSLR